jgi:peptide/nickel transport system permease protein
MTAFIIRRFLIMVPIMLLVGIICFLLVHFIPGSPAELMLGVHADTASIEALTKKMGYDQPIYVQLAKWFSMILRGDFGVSVYSRKPVISIIARRAEASMIIAFGATFLFSTFGILIGIISAKKRNSWLDQASMTLSLAFASMPSFWIGLNLMLIFAAILNWLPSSGYPGVLGTGNIKNLRYLILPCLTIAIPSSGLIARLTRSFVIDILSMEYVTTARSKGLKESVVIIKHVLRNALIPVVAAIGGYFAEIVSLSVVVETVFNVPGVGRLVVESILQRDYPTLQALLMLIAGLYIIINFLCDIVYAILDPRIQYD